jgi:hypothetical protein
MFSSRSLMFLRTGLFLVLATCLASAQQQPQQNQNYVTKWYSSSGSTLTNSSLFDNGSSIVSGSSVGIGVTAGTSPQAMLQVYPPTTGTNLDAIWFGNGGTTRTYPATNPPSGGNSLVGRGNTSDYRLEIQSGNGRVNQYWNAYTDSGGTSRYIVSGEPAARMFINVDGATNGVWAFSSAPAGTAGNAISWMQGAHIEPNNYLWLSPRGNPNDFYMTLGGSVGIGTANPGYTLEVNGSTQVDSNFTATGSVTASQYCISSRACRSESLQSKAPQESNCVRMAGKGYSACCFAEDFDKPIGNVAGSEAGGDAGRQVWLYPCGGGTASADCG